MDVFPYKIITVTYAHKIKFRMHDTSIMKYIIHDCDQQSGG